MSQELSIPFDELELSASLDDAEHPQALLLLAHGAGAGKDHEFLLGFSQTMAAEGISVLRFNFPYMDAGKKFPDRAPVAIKVWQAVRAWAQTHYGSQPPIFTAGKSFGGRMASLAVAEGMETQALIFLGYPLHAPGKEDKLRDEHLYKLQVPMLFLQGTKDPFANPEILDRVASGLNAESKVRWFENGNHSFKVARSGRTVAQDGESLAEATTTFIHRQLAKD